MDANQLATATACNLRGESIYEIAPKVGVHPSTVYRNLQRPEIRAKIEAEAAQIINRGLSQARRTITRLAAQGNVKGADKDTLKLALDASKHITSIAGLSGGTPGTIITNLIQINQAPEQTEELAAITGFLKSQWAQMDNKYPDGYKVSSEEVIDVASPHTPTPESGMSASGHGDQVESDLDTQDAPNRATIEGKQAESDENNGT